MNGGSVHTLLEAAVRHLQVGQLAEGEALLGEARRRAPDDADVLHLLGLVAYRSGRAGEAEGLIARAIAADGMNPAFHSNHGAALNLLGRPLEAEQACRRAIALESDFAEACNNLGLALELQERLGEAAEAYRRSIELNPENAAQAHNNLGNVLRRQGTLEAAIEAYRDAIRLAPSFAMALANLGAALREWGDLKDALVAGRRAVEIAPGYAEGYNALGNTLVAAGDADGAIDAFSQAVAIEPGYAEAAVNQAAALFTNGRTADAADAYRRVLERLPDLAEAHNALGVVLLAAGSLDEAVSAFRRAVALKPDYAEALYNLAAAPESGLGETDIAAMEALLTDERTTAAEAIALHFALSELRAGRGEPEGAFGHARQGNRVRRVELERQGQVFDADAQDRLIERIARTFDRGAFDSRAAFGEASELPVFIVGMPRSGTTLVEQIAASHSRVHGAGELDDIGRIASGLRKTLGSARPYPECAVELSAAGAAALARDHLERLRGLAGGALRVADKTPVNFLYLGLIALLFPGARIVHCRRDARDTCLSCYFQNFVAPHPWSTDLEDLGRYHRAYVRMMDHWREALRPAVLEVDYEDLVADPETHSRRIIDFLGLPWEEACLRPHRARRTVRSASNWQVHRPVYATSVGRWRAYAPFLGPLLGALESE